MFINSLVAGLAFLLFALDGTHVLTVVWLANRCAIIAAIFSLLMLWSYIRRREDDWLIGYWIALIAFILTLLSGEMGVSAFFYLASYIFILEKSSLSSKIRRLLPFALILLVYLVFYKLNGFGASGNTARYLDPFNEPMEFLSQAISRIPILLASQFGIIPADMSVGIFKGTLIWPVILASGLFFLLFIFYPMCLRDRLPLFFLATSILSTLPVIAGSPSDRNLFMVGVGGSGLIASCIHFWWRQRIHFKGVHKFFLSTTAIGLVFLHLVLSPILIPLISYAMIPMSELSVISAEQLPEGLDIEGKQIAFIHAPYAAVALFNPIRNWRDLPRPQQSWWITEAGRTIHISRLSGHTLRITMDGGFVAGDSERQFRLPAKNPFKVGDRVDLNGLAIVVKAVSNEGDATEIEATFAKRLDDRDLVFLSFINEKYHLQEIPQLGDSVTIR